MAVIKNLHILANVLGLLAVALLESIRRNRKA